MSQLPQEVVLPSWTHTPDQITAGVRQLEHDAVALADRIGAIAEPTLDNVLVPWKEFFDQFTWAECQYTFYQDMSPDKALRDAATEAEKQLQKTWIDLLMRKDVYEVFKKLATVLETDPRADDEDKRYVANEIRDYERAGLGKPEDQQQRIRALKVEVSGLENDFSSNCNEENGFVEFTAAELEGVPQDVIDGFKKNGDKYQMTFRYPDVLPVLRYANNQETRKRAYLGNEAKNPANGPLLEKIVQLRYKLGQELGYDTYLNYVLEKRMAKNQTNVLDFLEDLRAKLHPGGEAEVAKMLEFKNKDLEARGLPRQDQYYFWDLGYYNEKLLKEQYAVDNLKIAEYFPLEHVLQALFAIYETIFNIEIKKLDPPADKLWHPDAQVYAIYQDGGYMGSLYIDLHPREGKYTHAANFGINPGHENRDGSRHHPVTVLLCNFSKPTKDKPSLLKHSEVTTLAHEAGHGLHNILSVTRYAAHHGTNLERDAVELMSQILEYWTWTKDELKKLSKHYQTGEPLPDNLIDDLIRTKNVNQALFNLRQLHFATFDMKLHTCASQQAIDLLDMMKLWNEYREELTHISADGERLPGYASFAHMLGYCSGYYGYLYLSVFALDIYFSLFADDPLNVENGVRYRDTILRRGGSRDTMDNLIELLGREPNAEAFTKELGI